mmetsp:Transcript_24789/g.49545  ORF Transcript_24789/g.49545 Transcript_24789/m.49545 type:complete len:241 (+) Transcript_24789:377-1099(+)
MKWFATPLAECSWNPPTPAHCPWSNSCVWRFSSVSFTKRLARKPRRVSSPAKSPPDSNASGSIAVDMQAIMEPPARPSDATARMPTEEGKLQTVSPSSFVLHSPGKIRAVKNAMTPVPRKRADHMHMIFAAESPLRNMMLADDIASGKLARKTAMMKAIESLPSDCMNPMSMDSGIPSMRIPSQMLNATLLGGFPSASSPPSSPVPLLTVEYSSSSPASFFALAETEFEAPAVRIRFTTM